MGFLRKHRGASGLGLACALPWWFAGALRSPYLRSLANAGPTRAIADAAATLALARRAEERSLPCL